MAKRRGDSCVPAWAGASVLLLAVTLPVGAAETQCRGDCALQRFADAAAVGESDQPPDAAVDELEDEWLFDDLDDEFANLPSGFPDPFESFNRSVLGFNRSVDRWVLNPVTELYSTLLPAPVKRAIGRVVSNIDSVGILVNDLLQARPKRTATTFLRLAINTTVGLAGMFDPARRVGLEAHHADFGQTLAYAGTRSGPYLVVPLLGPSTARDAIGTITDSVMSPLTYWLGYGSAQRITYGGTAGLSLRELHLEGLRALESSVDYYAALRNGYYQTRQAELWHGASPPPWRQRVCRSMLARLHRQRWRIPHTCQHHVLE